MILGDIARIIVPPVFIFIEFHMVINCIAIVNSFGILIRLFARACIGIYSIIILYYIYMYIKAPRAVWIILMRNKMTVLFFFLS